MDDTGRADAAPEEAGRSPTFREALAFWLKLGCISFGGPAGQIALMHRELVEIRRWVDGRHFSDALNFCMVLPGPEAQQLATYFGWKMHGAKGGIAAGALFVLPSAVLLFFLSWCFVLWGELPWLAAIFRGLTAAIVAVVAHALMAIGRRSLKTPALWAVAGAAFAAIAFFKISFAVVIIAVGILGLLAPGLAPREMVPLPPSRFRPGWKRPALVLAVCLTLWWTPVIALGLSLGWQSTPAREGLFFSRAALVTFGGAYAVLPYVAQQAVEHHGWLTESQMMSGLALAETTPGPLVIVLQFVGFLGGWQHPGRISPLASATLGAAITTWVTFLPSFLFIFLGGPYIEQAGTLPRLRSAMTVISAAVVGGILNLALQLARHAVQPGHGQIDWLIAALSGAAFLVLWKRQLGILPVMALCGAAGLAAWWPGIH